MLFFCSLCIHTFLSKWATTEVFSNSQKREKTGYAELVKKDEIRSQWPLCLTQGFSERNQGIG